MRNLADSGAAKEACETCCYRFGEECRFASPNGAAKTLWPTIKMNDWCGRFRTERRKALRATDAAIIGVMDVVGELPHAEFVARVAEQFGIHPRSAEVKVERLIMRHRLDEVEGGTICLGRPRKLGRPKKGELVPDENEPVADGDGSQFGKWRWTLHTMFGTLEDAGMFSDLRNAAREFSPISNAAFSAMLRRAMEAGEVLKTEERKYWLQRLPDPAIVAPDGIEAP